MSLVKEKNFFYIVKMVLRFKGLRFSCKYFKYFNLDRVLSELDPYTKIVGEVSF